MPGKRPTQRRSVIMATKKSDTTTSASTLTELLVHDAAARNAALRAQIDQQANAIREIHQNEVENQKLSKIMDEYKRRNIELMKENSKLQSENERLRRELSSKISKKLEDFNDQIKDRERRVGDQEEQLTFIETQYRNLAGYLLNGEATFKEELQLTKESYQQKAKELDSATKNYHRLMHMQDKDGVIPTHLTQFLRQKEELLDLADERVRQLKVKEEESDALKKRIRELNQMIDKLKDEKVQLARMFPAKPPPAAVPGYRRRSMADALAPGRPNAFFKPPPM